MRLLILSCNTGEGHNSAARAIRQCLEDAGIVCEIRDALAFWSPEKSRIISKGHVFLYRNLPKLFGLTYRFEEKHPARDGDESLIYELMTKGCDNLLNTLTEEAYDAVICTHVFSAMMMTELRRSGALRLPTYFVSTDYTCCPGVSEIDCDAFFLPHQDLAGDFVANGVPEHLLVPSGIPVSAAFYQRTDRAAARRKLHLPTNRRVVLLTCGSMGCGPIRTLAKELPARISEDGHLVIICGSNKRLYRSLLKSELPDNVTLLGYTTQMSLYMDAADLILTKPGGLSSTEAAVKGLPMIFINAVPGCETRNLNFFLSNGFADTAASDALLTLVCDYVKDPEKAEAMALRLRNAFSFCAAERILDFLRKDLKL